MRMSSNIANEGEIRSYLIDRLRMMYPNFRKDVTDATRFDEFEKCCDVDLSDPGLLLYIESDFGVTISDADAQRIAERDVGELVHFIAERQNAPKVAGDR